MTDTIVKTWRTNPELLARIRARAAASGMSLNKAVNVLIEKGLKEVEGEQAK